MAELSQQVDLVADIVPASVLGGSDVHDHIDLVRPVRDGDPGLGSLCIGGLRAQWESDDGRNLHLGLLQIFRGAADVAPVDADRGKVISGGLREQIRDPGLGGVGFEQGVVKIFVEWFHHVPPGV